MSTDCTLWYQPQCIQCSFDFFEYIQKKQLFWIRIFKKFIWISIFLNIFKKMKYSKKSIHISMGTTSHPLLFFVVVTRPFVTARHVNLRFRPQRLFCIAKGSTRTLQANPHSNSGQSIFDSLQSRCLMGWTQTLMGWTLTSQRNINSWDKYITTGTPHTDM